MKEPIILEIALLNRRDAYHDWIKHQIKSINPPLLTNEAVMTEACFLANRDIVCYRKLSGLETLQCF